MTKMYKQCAFEKLNTANVGPESYQRTVAWIEAWAAKEGNMVQLTDLDNEFWKVVAVAEIPVSEEVMRTKERGFKQFQRSLAGGGIDE